MILIADSGSTKADWLLINKDSEKVAEFHTKGLNPNFHDYDFVLAELNANFDLNKYSDDVTEVYFYAAGASTEEMQTRLLHPFKQYFTNADIKIGHDLDAAVYATCEVGEPSIACILGTGSNSAYYDGKNVIDDIPALGYILGDEGSGTFFGKSLLSSYFYKKMPEHLRKKMDERYKLSKDEVFENVYMKPNANVYLASFSRFLSDNKDENFITDLMERGLLIFMDLHVCRYEDFRDIKTNFIGSISFFFEDILRDVAQRRGVNIDKVIKKPIYHLTKYHTQQIIDNDNY